MKRVISLLAALLMCCAGRAPAEGALPEGLSALLSGSAWKDYTPAESTDENGSVTGGAAACASGLQAGTVFSVAVMKRGNRNVLVVADQKNGKWVIAAKSADVLKQGKYSAGAAVIGHITDELPGKVTMVTEIGAETLLPQPGGELLPRIC